MEKNLTRKYVNGVNSKLEGLHKFKFLATSLWQTSFESGCKFYATCKYFVSGGTVLLTRKWRTEV